MIDAVAAFMGRPDPTFPPAALAAAFCGYARQEADGTTVHTGHAPYSEGYDALADLVSRGWTALPELGDWPLVIYLAWRRHDEPALVELVEGDVTLRVFPTLDALREFVRSL